MLRLTLMLLMLLTAGTTPVLFQCTTDAECESIRVSFDTLGGN